MGHKCFISFKKEDEGYKKEIQRWNEDYKVDMIDKSLNEAIDSENLDYVMNKKIPHVSRVFNNIFNWNE